MQPSKPITSKRNKIYAYLALALVLFLLLSYGIGLLDSSGDKLSAFMYVLSTVAILPFIILFMGMRTRMWEITWRPQIFWGLLAGTVAVAVTFLVLIGFGSHVAPAIIKSELRHHGTVATATVLHYDLYSSSGRGGHKVESFTEARRIFVRLQLPDGRHTSINLTSGYPGYRRYDLTREVVELQLLQGTLKVRYVQSAPWFVHPEIEFTDLTKSEACDLLGPSSRVCEL